MAAERLLEEPAVEAALQLQDTPLWRRVHAAAFALGGTTFIAGTSVYWAPPSDAATNAAAALYTLGSCGFLAVDLLELATPAYAHLRLNIGLSALGSSLYVVGSLGFLAPVLDITEAVGVWGFLLGSALIAVSQIWKVARIGWVAHRFGWRHVAASRDAWTAAAVEASAGVGAACFLVGTGMYAVASGPQFWFNAVLATWLLGSCAFTQGAGFLAYRHFVLHVS